MKLAGGLERLPCKLAHGHIFLSTSSTNNAKFVKPSNKRSESLCVTKGICRSAEYGVLNCIGGTDSEF